MKIAAFLTTTWASLTLSDHEDFKDISTTMGAISTISSTLGLSSTDVKLLDAKLYMESLSVGQLKELDEKLELKEMELSLENDNPKVRIYSKEYSSERET